MSKFQNKYRIPSARAPWWNYGDNAAYFITICTHNRVHYFGEIVGGGGRGVETQNFASLRSTEIGKFAEICWYEIPNHFPFVQLGAFVVMPNHIHGIITINKPETDTSFLSGIYSPTQLPANNKFGPQSQNLASIVRGFKIGVTKMAKQIRPDFKWQPRYHDHIIRDDAEYQRISYYIKTNPSNWNKDKFSKKENQNR
jgi:REP element-mobilizing transposase RayT